jgi:hypothetical protein
MVQVEKSEEQLPIAKRKPRLALLHHKPLAKLEIASVGAN